MAEIVLEITLLAFPTLTKEEVQLADLSVLALPTKLTIIKVVNDEGPNMEGLSVVLATIKILPTTIELSTSEVIGEAMGEAA